MFKMRVLLALSLITSLVFSSRVTAQTNLEIELTGSSITATNQAQISLNNSQCDISNCLTFLRDRREQDLEIPFAADSLSPFVPYKLQIEAKYFDPIPSPESFVSERLFLEYTSNSLPVITPLGSIDITNSDWNVYEFYFEVPSDATNAKIVLSDYETKLVTGSNTEHASFALKNVSMSLSDRQNWREYINSGIQNRKQEYSLTILDDGQVVPNQQFELQLTKPTFMFGGLYNTLQAAAKPQYTPYLLEHFDALILDDIGRMGILMDSPSSFVQEKLDSLDATIALAKENNLTLFGHTLINGTPRPDWLQTLSKEEILAAMDLYLETVLSPERGPEFAYFDLGIHFNSKQHDALYQIIDRQELVAHVAAKAKSLSPTTKLGLSDHGILDGRSYAQSNLKMLTQYLQAGVPMDYFAIQGHFRDEHTINPYYVIDQLDYMSQAGLPLVITEFDIVNSELDTRGNNVSVMYQLALAHPNVLGIYSWGFDPQYHWRGPNAGWINSDYSLNAAGLAYRDLQNEWRQTVIRGVNSQGQSSSIPLFPGTYTLTLPDLNKQVEITLDASSQVTIDLSRPQTGCAFETDLNNDSRVDLIDYGILISEFFTESTGPANIDCIGTVDLFDYSLLLEAFSLF